MWLKANGKMGEEEECGDEGLLAESLGLQLLGWTLCSTSCILPLSACSPPTHHLGSPNPQLFPTKWVCVCPHALHALPNSMQVGLAVFKAS